MASSCWQPGLADDKTLEELCTAWIMRITGVVDDIDGGGIVCYFRVERPFVEGHFLKHFWVYIHRTVGTSECIEMIGNHDSRVRTITQYFLITESVNWLSS